MQLSRHIAQKSTPTQKLCNISHRADMIRQHDTNWLLNFISKKSKTKYFGDICNPHFSKYLKTSKFSFSGPLLNQGTQPPMMNFHDQTHPATVLIVLIRALVSWRFLWSNMYFIHKWLNFQMNIDNIYIYVFIWIYDMCSFIFANSKCLYIHIYIYSYLYTILMGKTNLFFPCLI